GSRPTSTPRAVSATPSCAASASSATRSTRSAASSLGELALLEGAAARRRRDPRLLARRPFALGEHAEELRPLRRGLALRADGRAPRALRDVVGDAVIPVRGRVRRVRALEAVGAALVAARVDVLRVERRPAAERLDVVEEALRVVGAPAVADLAVLA